MGYGRTTPADHFGFAMGSTGHLASWDALLAYYRHLEATSPNVHVLDLGRTTEDREFAAVLVSSPSNLSRLDEFRELQQHLYDPRHASDEQKRTALEHGRAIVVINCSMHPAEAGATQAAPHFVHWLLTDTSSDSRTILENVILIIIPSMNPDGLELVRRWYVKSLDTPAEGTWPPSITHKYCGGDNSYDWATLTQIEARHVVSKIFNVWHPHVFLDMHQMEPDGFRCILPPSVDPVDPIVDPVIRSQMASFGMEIAARMTAEGLTGVATGIYFGSSSADHDYARYHNCISLLSEVASSNIASTFRFTESLKPLDGFDPRQPSGNHPAPWQGSQWSFGDVLAYDLSIMRNCLATAAQRRREIVVNYAAAQSRACAMGEGQGYVIDTSGRGADSAWDTIAILKTGGAEVERTSNAIIADGHVFPAGSFFITQAQPSAPFIKAVLDPTPFPPSAIDANSRARAFDRSASFDWPKLTGLRVALVAHPSINAAVSSVAREPGQVDADGTSHLICRPTGNCAVLAVNRLLKAGVVLERLTRDDSAPAGSFLVRSADRALVETIARDTFTEWRDAPQNDTVSSRLFGLPRLGVYKSYLTGFGVCDEGWLRFILDTYEFPFETIHNEDIKAGGLADRFDAVIFPQQLPRDIVHGYDPRRFQGAAAEVEDPDEISPIELPESPYPPQYRGGIGKVGLRQVRDFAQAGGTVIGIDSASSVVIEALGLPITNLLRHRPRSDFNLPGSLVRLDVDSQHPLGYGFADGATAVFQHSPAFGISSDAIVVARHARMDNVVAGWAHGAEQLRGLPALLELEHGAGRAILFGFRPYHRAQARGTYQFLFNALYASSRAWRTVDDYFNTKEGVKQ